MEKLCIFKQKMQLRMKPLDMMFLVKIIEYSKGEKYKCHFYRYLSVREVLDSRGNPTIEVASFTQKAEHWPWNVS